MPDHDDNAVLPGPRTRDNEGRRHIPRDEAKGKAWLSWRSHGCKRGLKAHQVNSDGSIREIVDSMPEPRRKPKTVSSRQWDHGGRS